MNTIIAQDFLDWRDVRDAYVLQTPLLNLNNAAVSPPTKIVEAAVIEAIRFTSQNPDYNMWSKIDLALPSIKQDLAELIDCDADEIALNRNSSEGLSTAIFGIPLAAQDEVVICPWNYPSARAGWLQRESREGIKVVEAKFDLMADDDQILAAYADAITSRTKVLHLTHMVHWTGRVLPVKELCRMAQGRGIVTVIDGAQTFAQMPVSFRGLGCDYFITSLHKWLGAPVGNGMLVVNKNRIADTWPLMAPFDKPLPVIEKFDHWNLGTYSSAVQSGIAPAVAFHKRIGAARMHARLKELTLHWVNQARSIPGFRLHTPIKPTSLGAVVLFSIDGQDMRKLERILREAWQVHVKYREVGPIKGLRVSPHVYMTESELDRFVTALRASVG
ncbi:aminotransferase class V-fold PLP-dependent enzyme [Paracoccus rhizosphaerae]|uniref:Aminotransferase class V-fold PLP-dependent enzyme n=1 Tax=Paracoccus rhizosphaerae TaxID=1133347 RepID=A0ABV6CDQ8_9RHOB|nr:aminotransferase class V-fold PLP-dependent enzyme [Paracoccus rhizosphaerae]